MLGKTHSDERGTHRIGEKCGALLFRDFWAERDELAEELVCLPALCFRGFARRLARKLAAAALPLPPFDKKISGPIVCDFEFATWFFTRHCQGSQLVDFTSL